MVTEHAAVGWCVQLRASAWDSAGASPAAAGTPARRLVSFTPGVPFGEIGMLRGQQRSADALAEEDAVILQLDRPVWQRLAPSSRRCRRGCC
jgi:CRP-like cAMP-binding protein